MPASVKRLMSEKKVFHDTDYAENASSSSKASTKLCNDLCLCMGDV